MKDVLIIGAGPVGIYAWHLGKLMGLNGYVIEKNNKPGGQLSEVYPNQTVKDIPSVHKITAQEVVDGMRKQAEENDKNFELMLSTNIKSIIFRNGYFTVTTNSNLILEVKTVLFTTGNGMYTPREHPILKNGKNTFYKVDDIISACPKKICILGGGDSAIDAALQCAKEATIEKISLIHRRKEYAAIKKNNIELMRANSKISEINPANIEKIHIKENNLIDKIEITLPDKSFWLESDAYLIKYGAQMLKSDFYNLDFQVNKCNKILTSSEFKTTHQGVYAAGNAVFYEGKNYSIISGLGEVSAAMSSISKYINNKQYVNSYWQTK